MCTEKPRDIYFFTVSGVMATLVSLGVVSLMADIIIRRSFLLVLHYYINYFEKNTI